MKIIPCLFIVFSVLVSCTKSGTKNNDIVLDFSNVCPSSLTLNVEKEQINVVNLKTPSGIYIGSVKQVLNCDSGIVVVDNSINLFSKEGIFLRKLSSRGKGPEEYLSIDKVRFEESSIFILDRRKMTISEFRWDGCFVKSIDLQANAYDFEFVDDSTVALFHGSIPFKKGNYRVSFFNINSKEYLACCLEYPIEQVEFLNFLDISNFIKRGNKILLSFSGNMTTYIIDNECILNRMTTFDFGVKTLTPDYIEKKYSDVMEFANLLDRKSIYYRLFSTQFIGDRLVTLTNADTINHIIAHGGSKKNKIYSSISINGSKQFSIGNSYFPMSSNNSQLIFAISAVDIKENEAMQQIFNDLLGIPISSINLLTNPFLLFVDNNVFINENIE